MSRPTPSNEIQRQSGEFKKYRTLYHEYYTRVSKAILKLLPNVKESEQSIAMLLPRVTTERLMIPNDIKEKIFTDIKIAYKHKNGVEYYGNYYEQLLKFGFKLDVTDEMLLNSDLVTIITILLFYHYYHYRIVVVD